MLPDRKKGINKQTSQIHLYLIMLTDTFRIHVLTYFTLFALITRRMLLISVGCINVRVVWLERKMAAGDGKQDRCFFSGCFSG